jgi:hypothetical protein
MNNNQKTSFNIIESNQVSSNNTDYAELKNIKEFLKKEKDLEKDENICVLTPKGWKKLRIIPNDLE